MFGRYQRYEEIIKNKRVGLMSTIGVLIAAVITTVIILSANAKNEQPVVYTQTIAPSEIELTFSYRYGGVSLMLPDGFYSSGKGEYSFAKNRITQDYALFATLDAAGDGLLSEDAVKEFLAKSSSEAVKELKDVKEYEIDGRPALYFTATYAAALEQDGISGVFIRFDDRTVAIVFHEYSDRYTDAFARCLGAIRVDGA